MSDLTIAILEKAVEGLDMRLRYTSQNIANASSNSYSSVKVSFETALVQAAQGSVLDVQNVAPRLESDDRADISSELRLDIELAEAVQTSMRYSAMVEVLSRQMSLKRIALGRNQ